jgi:hypothetical protein
MLRILMKNIKSNKNTTYTINNNTSNNAYTRISNKHVIMVTMIPRLLGCLFLAQSLASSLPRSIFSPNHCIFTGLIFRWNV